MSTQTEHDIAIKFAQWITGSGWHISRDYPNCWDMREGRLLSGMIIKTVTTEKLFDIYLRETK